MRDRSKMSHRKQWQLKAREKRKASNNSRDSRLASATRQSSGVSRKKPSLSPASIIHRYSAAPPHLRRPAYHPQWSSRDRIAMPWTSKTTGEARSTGRTIGLRGYDVVEARFGGGRARVVGAGTRNSSCRALSARSRKDGRCRRHRSEGLARRGSGIAKGSLGV